MLGRWGAGQSTNRFAYSLNSPVTSYDLNGLLPIIGDTCLLGMIDCGEMDPCDAPLAGPMLGLCLLSDGQEEGLQAATEGFQRALGDFWKAVDSYVASCGVSALAGVAAAAVTSGASLAIAGFACAQGSAVEACQKFWGATACDVADFAGYANDAGKVFTDIVDDPLGSVMDDIIDGVF